MLTYLHVDTGHIFIHTRGGQLAAHGNVLCGPPDLLFSHIF